MSDHPRLGLSELHLAAEAIAAYLDGELASGPRQRAAQHLDHCIECREVLAVQRQAKSALGLACTPPPAQDLLAKLRNIPVDTELPGAGGPDMTLAMYGDQLVWCRQAPRPDPQPEPRPASEPTASLSQLQSSDRSHWGVLRGGLVGAAAAVLVGMLAATTPSAAGGTGAQQPATPDTPERSVETTDVVTASIPHVFGDAPLLLDPRPGTAMLSSGPRP